MTLVTTGESADGSLFALIEDEERQYVFTWRRDDANEWAVFSECAIDSITARAVRQFVAETEVGID